jgi:hypothetical protein
LEVAEVAQQHAGTAIEVAVLHDEEVEHPVGVVVEHPDRAPLEPRFERQVERAP